MISSGRTARAGTGPGDITAGGAAPGKARDAPEAAGWAALSQTLRRPATRRRSRRRALAAAAAAAVAAVLAAGCSSRPPGASLTPGAAASGAAGTGLSAASVQAAEANQNLDIGGSLGGQPAPDFRLVNQFGQPMSLSQFRGKVVLLAFVDAECTTVCPLTTVEMLGAKQLLGAAGNQVQLLGVDANPVATKISDVMAYSRAHAMVNRWDFLTGSKSQLAAVWKKYHIYAQVSHGMVDHTPALFLLGKGSTEQRVYLTGMAYSSIGQEEQIMAQEISRLLPGHTAVASHQSLSYVGGLTPRQTVTMPSASPAGGTVTLAAGTPHLVMFFATWLTETSDLKSELAGLNSYAQAARTEHLPPLTAADEAATEPSPGTVRGYLTHLGAPLDYPVGLDTTGRVADGYGAQDQPWYVLTSASGKITWSHDGWLPPLALEQAVKQHAASGH